MSADIIHPGHINILKTASEYGKVTVGLLTDKAIASYKKIPVMTYDERYKVVEGIKYVDNIVMQETLDYSDNLKNLKPKYTDEAFKNIHDLYNKSKNPIFAPPSPTYPPPKRPVTGKRKRKKTKKSTKKR